MLILCKVCDWLLVGETCANPMCYLSRSTNPFQLGDTVGVTSDTSFAKFQIAALGDGWIFDGKCSYPLATYKVELLHRPETTKVEGPSL